MAKKKTITNTGVVEGVMSTLDMVERAEHLIGLADQRVPASLAQETVIHLLELYEDTKVVDAETGDRPFGDDSEAARLALLAVRLIDVYSLNISE